MGPSPWLESMSGHRFELLDDAPTLPLDDLVWGCARQGRYNGQWRTDVDWYSVAEHSVHVGAAVEGYYDDLAEDQTDIEVDPETRGKMVRTALCHDLVEGIMGDAATPLKSLLPEFREIEARAYSALAKRFDLFDPLPGIVKSIDYRILLDETEQLMLPDPDRMKRWGIPSWLQPVGVKVQAWDVRTAYHRFRGRLEVYGIL